MSIQPTLRYSDVCKSGTNKTRAEQTRIQNQVHPNPRYPEVDVNNLLKETGWETLGDNSALQFIDLGNSWETQPDHTVWGRPLEQEPPRTLEEMKIRESHIHVDLVGVMVPYWIKGVEAAERGETLKLEHFLEKIAAQGTSGWWGVAVSRPARSHKTGSGWSQEKGWGNADEWGNAPTKNGWADEHGNGWGASTAPAKIPAESSARRGKQWQQNHRSGTNQHVQDVVTTRQSSQRYKKRRYHDKGSNVAKGEWN